MKQRIGFIGVGLMGHGMAKNIVEKGFPLTVLGHKKRAPVEDLKKRGAKEAKTVKALMENSDVIILCVTGTPQVEEMIDRADGIRNFARKGMTVIDCSTSEPPSTAKLHAEMKKRRRDIRRCTAHPHTDRSGTRPTQHLGGRGSKSVQSD